MTERHPAPVEQDVIRRYETGERTHDIAKATGVGLGTIYTIIKRAGITPRRRNHREQARDQALELALELLNEPDRQQVLDILNKQ